VQPGEGSKNHVVWLANYPWLCENLGTRVEKAANTASVDAVCKAAMLLRQHLHGLCPVMTINAICMIYGLN
jgi:hypothetical protein